jgi:hypothetical protein
MHPNLPSEENKVLTNQPVYKPGIPKEFPQDSSQTTRFRRLRWFEEPKKDCYSRASYLQASM